jgi:hypothetical protein
VTIADNSVDSNSTFATIEGAGATAATITGNTGWVWHASCGTDNIGGGSKLPGGDFPAVILWNTPGGSITNNTFLAADPGRKARILVDHTAAIKSALREDSTSRPPADYFVPKDSGPIGRLTWAVVGGTMLFGRWAIWCD